MTESLLHVAWLGDAGLTLELKSPSLDAILGLAAAIDAEIAAGRFPGAIETLPALRSVTLFFDPLVAKPQGWIGALEALAAARPERPALPREWQLPVCFDPAFAPDLPALAARQGVTADTLIDALLESVLSVRMLGFLPGFAYLGDLPSTCRAPRLVTPRPVVPRGSLGVAGPFCALYPWDSPGGWNLVGRTPIALFDATASTRPALLAPGDIIRWRLISRAQFDHWTEPSLFDALKPVGPMIAAATNLPQETSWGMS